ncbi:bifunctional riboflavin kinase/FAD synthetase [Aestuariibacter salexigens]|uniref:bifunctional riboflavin kinase/FAD synthetase n=1 Tax=Aestuariibacter salexigens TaxID=226010 RepID=UPI00047A04A8|nr:bifunctional riboflavin kinase/FAD synthetase [Aestuariibacter salexigens]
MELIRGLHNLREKHQGCVLTIGKFDGVHLGHQAVLRNLVKKAHDMGLPATVMVFEPQPEEVFTPDSAPARLSRLRDKYNALKALGIDRLLCVKFDQRFASFSAEHFVQALLVEQLGVKFLVVGDDFKFGQRRLGDFTMLQKAGEQFGFDVASTHSFMHDASRISSTAIRDALADGAFALAEQMLGRPFAITGRVVHGDKKGRTIGFPTANVLLKRRRAPLSGVFAVQVKIGAEMWHGVANIGTRPTVHGVRSQLEVHVFDLDKNLYGQMIDVIPRAKIRQEKKFDSFDLLKEQIQRDAEQAKYLLTDII